MRALLYTTPAAMVAANIVRTVVKKRMLRALVSRNVSTSARLTTTTATAGICLSRCSSSASRYWLMQIKREAFPAALTMRHGCARSAVRRPDARYRARRAGKRRAARRRAGARPRELREPRVPGGDGRRSAGGGEVLSRCALDRRADPRRALVRERARRARNTGGAAPRVR